MKNKRKFDISKLVLPSYFISIFIVSLFLFQSGRWFYYHDNTGMNYEEIEQYEPYDKVYKPDPTKKYFIKIGRTTTIKSKSFPIVETTEDNKNLGLWERKK